MRRLMTGATAAGQNCSTLDEPEQTYAVRGRDIAAKNYVETLSAPRYRVALPESPVGVIEYVFRSENAGFSSRLVFSVQGRRISRPLAGEVVPRRRRFRHSRALCSVNLTDSTWPTRSCTEPDVYGKVGNLGVMAS